MKLAISINIPMSEFWEMTLDELNMCAAAYREKKKEDYKEKISVAYHNAMWTIQWLGKKSQQPKPLQNILDNLYKEKRIMTDDEMLRQVRFLNKLFDGEEKIVNPC